MGQFEHPLGTIIALILALVVTASIWSHSRERSHLMEARRIWLYVAEATKQVLFTIINVARQGVHHAHA